jgi:tetratricopeptide (TPR) repeat protein
MAKYQAEVEQKNSAEAISSVKDDFDLLIDSYGNTPAGRLARVFYGHICIAGQEYDKAIENYSRALVEFNGEPSMTKVILNGLALAYQQKGAYPQAIAYYRKLVDGPGSMLKDAALFNLGKLHGQIGQLEKSRQAYQRLNSDFPNSIYANIAREKITG